MKTVHKTICPRDCPDSCFMTVTVENGTITQIKGDPDHPVTNGLLCPRGMADIQRVYSKERVLYPYQRTSPKPLLSSATEVSTDQATSSVPRLPNNTTSSTGINSQTRGLSAPRLPSAADVSTDSQRNSSKHFQRIAMDDALNLIADRLKAISDRHGAESVLLLDYFGNAGSLAFHFPQRLWYAIGATTTDYALCSNSGHEALALHYGLSYGIDAEELTQQKVITFWGFNAKVSAMHLWRLACQARKKNGARIVVIDPRQSESAAFADTWLQPNPGTDVALSFGIARYLIEQQLVAENFLKEWTVGFDYYKEEVLKWTPGRIEQLTGIQWEQIVALAQLYAAQKSCAFMIGIGFQKSNYGAEAVRGVSLLPALLGRHRGFYYSNSRGRFIDWDDLSGVKWTEKKSKIVSQVSLGRRLQAGEFKFIFIKGMNPVMTLPFQQAVRQGLSRADTFVVLLDTHWTATADYADVILPAATFLEKDDIIVADSHPYTRLCPKIIAPLGESKSEVWFMQQLAAKLRRTELWLYEAPFDAVGRAFDSSFENGTFADLEKNVMLKVKKKPQHAYQTLSGKMEFFSQKAKELGLNPLPAQLPFDRDNNEFLYLTSAVSSYTHTQFQDVYGAIPEIVWIHPADARNIGIHQSADGARIRLFNDYGAIEVRAVITNKIPRGVLWSPKLLTGLNGQPQNEVMSDETQTIGGSPALNSTKVRIKLLDR